MEIDASQIHKALTSPLIRLAILGASVTFNKDSWISGTIFLFAVMQTIAAGVLAGLTLGAFFPKKRRGLR